MYTKTATSLAVQAAYMHAVSPVSMEETLESLVRAHTVAKDGEVAFKYFWASQFEGEGETIRERAMNCLYNETLDILRGDFEGPNR